MKAQLYLDENAFDLLNWRWADFQKCLIINIKTPALDKRCGYICTVWMSLTDRVQRAVGVTEVQMSKWVSTGQELEKKLQDRRHTHIILNQRVEYMFQMCWHVLLKCSWKVNEMLFSWTNVTCRRSTPTYTYSMGQMYHLFVFVIETQRERAERTVASSVTRLPGLPDRLRWVKDAENSWMEDNTWLRQPRPGNT